TRALNVGNYANESSAIQFAFNLGGAVGDSSWIEAGETPSAGVHVPSDPFAPYSYGAVIVPTTGQFVVNVSGTQGVQSRASRIGVNSSFDAYTYYDATSLQAATVNGGLNGLFPFYRPSMESAPWEYWDSTYWKNVPHPTLGNFHLAGLATNPDMSRAKELAYIDSSLAFIVPRIVCSMGLPGCTNATTGEVEQLEPNAVSVFPNPSASFVNIRTESAGNQLESITVTDLSGRQVKVANGIKNTSYRLDHADLTPGMYFLTIQTRKGVLTQKVLFN
ncbi:MAG TPA: T9SS type A sorting domain-containing protein, partial [Bacteroidia bacterium]|nr:T9SS type A sorting domain-containing protein [Bacteroidia bacterium]